MKILLHPYIYVALYYFVFPLFSKAQAPMGTDTTAIPHLPVLAAENNLFESDELLEVTLSGNIYKLINDRAVKSTYYPMRLLYRGIKNSEISLPVDVKTRGHFRKVPGNCFYPPLLVQFSKTDSLKSSVFKEQDKLKLVMPCQGEEYVIKEWLVYKLYNLVTAKSFRTRLVRLKLEDAKKKKAVATLYGILLESEKQMARRNSTIAITWKLRPEQTETNSFLTMAVFEFLIGNTDWCIQYLQNIKLVAKDSNSVPTAVPYDFDHAGLVNAPYASPAEELRMRSVLERRYRGYCLPDLQQFEEVIALYNQLKKSIYEVYTNCDLLDEGNKKAVFKYLDEFYMTINDPKKWQREFSYPCDKNGTGNVIIKGMRED